MRIRDSINPVGVAIQRFALALTVGVAAVGGMSPQAQAVPTIFTWTSGVSGNWSDGSKWSNDLATGSAPVTGGQANYTLNFTPAGTYTATNDLSDGFLLNQLNFGGATTLDGTNGLALTTNGTTLPEINQDSGSGVTISLPLSLAADATFGGTGSGQVVMSNEIFGPGSLRKNGPGTLRIDNATNTYSGGTIINSGTLKMYVQANTALGTGPVTLNGGTLFLERINAANALTVNGGKIHADNGFGDSWSGPVTLNVDLTVENPGYATMTFGGIISGAGGLILDGPGPVRLTAANDYTGDTTVNGGTLVVSGSSINDAGKLIIDGGKVQATGTETVDTLFFDTGQQESGTWGATGSGAVNIDDLHFTGTAGVVEVTTGLPKDEADILAFGLPGAPAVITGTDIAWIVPVGFNVANLAPTFELSYGAVATPVSGTPRNFTTPQTYSVDSGDGTILNKIYAVTVTQGPVPATFTWASAVTGSWSDASKWTNDLATGTGPGSFGGSFYALNFTEAGSYTATHDLSDGFLLNQLNFGGAATLDGTNGLALTADGTTLPQINQDSGNGVTISLPLILADDTTFGGTGSGQVIISKEISGTGRLTKNGPGTLRIDNATNTYSGGTIINSGTLYMGVQANEGLGTGSVTLNGGTLFLQRVNATNALTVNGGKIHADNGFGDSWSGPVTLNVDLTVENPGYANMTFGGIISGVGGLILNDPGAVYLTAANDYTGGTTVNGGTLAAASLNRVSGGTATSNLGAPADAASGTITLGNNAILLYNGPGETTDRVIKLAGTTGGATLTQAGTASGIPTTRGDSGRLIFTSNLSIPGTAAADNRKTLTLTHATSSTTGATPGRGEISGSIGDSLAGTAGQLATSVTKAGAGTWTLSGANTYSGATKVQAGTLAFARADALGGGALDISTGAKVRLDYIGTRQISALTFHAGTAQPDGTYGSSASLATFKDDTRFAGPGTVTVGAITAPTTTTLARTAGADPSNGGAAVTFTATVAGAAPTGSVMFYDGLTLIGTSALDGSHQASLTTATLGGGTHAITALYGGNASTALAQTVVDSRAASSTTLALTGGTNPSSQGAAVTFTATVAGTAPTGNVTFHDGDTVLGAAALNGSAQASVTTSGFAVGWRAITARYEGDASHMASAATPPLFLSVNPPAGNGRLKVFILAGQSNMVGKGRVETGRDPDNLTNTGLVGGLGSLRNMLDRNPDKYGYLADPDHPTGGGNPGWLTREDVWVTYWGESNGENRRGILDADFGDYGGQGRIGPEYGFGLVAGSQLGDQVLIIKYAFGGKSLITDFRPPSSGGSVGPYYTGMVARVHQVLDNLTTYFPAYGGQGYEIAGFGWHQGWNDLGEATAVYETNLTNLIADVRAEFGVPNLPVVIGNTGMANGAGGNVLVAQMNVGNPALHPEFAGTVTTVDTRPFDYGTLLGGSSEGYHWNWNAESYFNIGESMGQAMMTLISAATPAEPYDSWASEHGLTGGAGSPTDPAFDADPNNDSVANGLVWMLGGTDPLADNRAILPRSTAADGGLTLEFISLKPGELGTASLAVQYGADLDSWQSATVPDVPAIPGSDVTIDGVVFTVAGHDATHNHVVATIPESSLPGGRIFARLHATGP